MEVVDDNTGTASAIALIKDKIKVSSLLDTCCWALSEEIFISTHGSTGKKSNVLYPSSRPTSS
jgi:hypothetical protein